MTITSGQHNSVSAVQRIHPHKFMLWLAMASILMFFGGLMSAIMVQRGDVRVWKEFNLPSVFLYSTLIIVFSSLTMQWALKKYSEGKTAQFRLFAGITLLIALGFLYMQYHGFAVLKQIGLPLNGTVSGSFVYAISLCHAAHYVLGIGWLLVIMLITKYYKTDKKYTALNQINPIRKVNIEVLTNYWHFIGFVWVLIFLFFKFVIYN